MNEAEVRNPQNYMSFDGVAFINMSDEYLLEVFDLLSVRQSRNNDWDDEWIACKAKILQRMKEGNDL